MPFIIVTSFVCLSDFAAMCADITSGIWTYVMIFIFFSLLHDLSSYRVFPYGQHICSLEFFKFSSQNKRKDLWPLQLIGSLAAF